MTGARDVLDAAVVGAGWAGLGVSHALKQRGLRHQVLERARIGESWRTQRWDSFRFNTPNSQTVMPGMSYAGPDPDGAMTSAEFVALLEDYAVGHGLPVRIDVHVSEMVTSDGLFRLATPGGALWARSVVIACGNQNVPVRPALSAKLPAGLKQIDASDYRSPAGLAPGAILVVGSAQSGGQIAEDLVGAGRTVYLSTSRVGRLPHMYRGSHIMDWLVRSGRIDQSRIEMLEQQGRIVGRPLTGAVHTLSLQSVSAQGVLLLRRLTEIDGTILRFDDSVEDHLRFAGETSENARRAIEEYSRQSGISAPAAEADANEVVAARIPQPPIRSLDVEDCGITTVIWCTGFKGDFSWIQVPGLLDAEGRPVHDHGVGSVPGTYFAGLAFAVSRRSGTILAIAEEASRYARMIEQRNSMPAHLAGAI
ncbi:MAG: NAD(P)-binding domain-containing protein [Rhizobiaceae bacterium]|nr:NAD(P)-binding domain-containing protein [Rhizobiaceae bacterium]